jgi:hypothetical protein
MFCPKCNVTLNEGDKFCHACGFPIAETKQVTAPLEEHQNQEQKVNAATFTGVKSDEVIANVKSGNFFRRMLYILINPGSEWNRIAKEKPRVAMMIFSYLLILGIIAFVAVFFGDLFDRLRYGIDYHDMYIVSIYNVIRILGLISSPIIAAIIINAICPSFRIEKNFGKVMQLTCFSFTPVLILWTMYLIPFPFITYIVHILSLYGILIFFMGYKKILNPPRETQIGFFFASVGILYGVYYCLYYTIQFLSPLFWRSGISDVIPH